MTPCTYTDPNVALLASLLRSPAVCEGFFRSLRWDLHALFHVSPNLSEIPVVAIVCLEKTLKNGEVCYNSSSLEAGFPWSLAIGFCFQKFPWFGSCQSGRTHGPPFVVWTFHFAVDPHARAHSRKKPIPHHYLWGAWVQDSIYLVIWKNLYFMVFAIHLATGLLWWFIVTWFVRVKHGQTWQNHAKSTLCATWSLSLKTALSWRE